MYIFCFDSEDQHDGTNDRRDPGTDGDNMSDLGTEDSIVHSLYIQDTVRATQDRRPTGLIVTPLYTGASVSGVGLQLVNG